MGEAVRGGSSGALAVLFGAPVLSFALLVFGFSIYGSVPALGFLCMLPAGVGSTAFFAVFEPAGHSPCCDPLPCAFELMALIFGVVVTGPVAALGVVLGRWVRRANRHHALLLLALTFLLAACSSREVSIATKPAAAELYLDGERLGPAPLVQKIDFSDKPRRSIVATAPGHFRVERVVTKETFPTLSRGDLELVLPEDPSYAATTRCDAANNWVRISASPIQAPDLTWQRLVDALTDRYASLEQLDDASGYVRTAPLIRRFRGPQGDFRIRTRFIAAIAQRAPLTYKVRIECDRAERDDDWQPWSRPFGEDAQLLEELRARIASSGPVRGGFPKVQPGSEPNLLDIPPFHCQECGTPTPETARFCPGCGQKLRAGAAR